jgi:carboxyl-terminal processing protease
LGYKINAYLNARKLKNYAAFFTFLAIASLAFGQTSTEVIRQAFVNIEQNYYDTSYHEVLNWDTTKSLAFQAAKNGESPQMIIHQVFKEVNDPALRYLTPEAFHDFYKESMNAKTIGVGLPELFSVDIDIVTKEVIVITPMYGSPAFEAGILPNDVIKKINGQTVKGKQLHEIAQLMRGKVGDIVNIKIQRDSTFKNFALEIKHLETPLNPFYRIIQYKKQKIGVIWIPQFSSGCSMRVLQILNDMKSKGVKQLILDIRHNPGGMVNEAQAVAGLFIGQKPMVFSQMKSSAIKMLATTTTKRCELPLTILTNQGTASVAEAFAGVLQYYQRGKIVGEKTSGKGLIYSFFTLNDLSTLVIPVGRMRLLDGRDILNEGIQPDEIYKDDSPFSLQDDYEKDKLLFHVIKKMK